MKSQLKVIDKSFASPVIVTCILEYLYSKASFEIE